MFHSPNIVFCSQMGQIGSLGCEPLVHSLGGGRPAPHDVGAGDLEERPCGGPGQRGAPSGRSRGHLYGIWGGCGQTCLGILDCELQIIQAANNGIFIVPLSVLVYPYLVLCPYCPIIVIPTPLFPHRCFCIFPPSYAHPRRCSRPVVVFFCSGGCRDPGA